MRRVTLFMTILIALAIPTSCGVSGGNQTQSTSDPKVQLSPAPPSTTEATTTTAPTTTTTSLPLILDEPIFQTFCSDRHPYCIELPTMGDKLDARLYVPEDKPSVEVETLEYGISINPPNGLVCTRWYESPAECSGFDYSIYTVHVQPIPDMTADEAMAMVERERYADPGFQDIHRGTFAGSRAYIAEFHNNQDGIGVYITLWHNGALYEISTNGQTGRAYQEQQVLNTFKFTD